MAGESQIRKASVGLIFVRGIVAFAIFALLVIAWFRFAEQLETYDEKRKAVRLEKLKTLHAEEEKKLNSYAWVDKQKGSVQIPVASAMKLALAELRAKPVQASTVKAVPPPVDTPLQPGAGGAVPSPVPAASPEVKK
jgi:preprotein translocase subunit Sec63